MTSPLVSVIVPTFNRPKLLARALESIRNHPKYKNTPVLMFSSSTDADDIIRAFDAGSDGYLEKPFSGEEFFSAIGNISKFKKLLLQELN